MRERDNGLGLTAAEVASPFLDPELARRYPPIMTAQQAAELLQVPLSTIYDWSSRGLLKGCMRKMGKGLRFFRQRLIQKMFNEGLQNEQ